jgi:hypothetical protein
MQAKTFTTLDDGHELKLGDEELTVFMSGVFKKLYEQFCC